MATVRLTKKQFESAAKDMASIAFESKLKKAYEDMRSYGDAIIGKYIPSEVIHCMQEHQTWFYANRVIGVYYFTGNYNTSSIYLSTNLNCPSKCIEVTNEEYDKASKLRSVISSINNEKNAYQTRLYDALCNLRTITNIKKELPEALDYIKMPTLSDNVPAIKYDALRDIFNTSRSDKN